MPKRQILFLTDKQNEQLRFLSEEMGLSMSAIIRLALSDFHKRFLLERWKADPNSYSIDTILKDLRNKYKVTRGKTKKK